MTNDTIAKLTAPQRRAYDSIKTLCDAHGKAPAFINADDPIARHVYRYTFQTMCALQDRGVIKYATQPDGETDLAHVVLCDLSNPLDGFHANELAILQACNDAGSDGIPYNGSGAVKAAAPYLKPDAYTHGISSGDLARVLARRKVVRVDRKRNRTKLTRRGKALFADNA